MTPGPRHHSETRPDARPATHRAALADAPWLTGRPIRRLFAALEVEGDAAWVVGGAVRNTLMGLPVADVDVATTAVPELTSRRATAAGLKVIPTGIAHGTVTVVVEGHPFEVTTLRTDIETDGRRAVVAFGRDWAADAHRRDFTMNALYCSADGTVHDFVGGIEDCLARRVRFIGDPDARIREDYLRSLRFFRFHAAYGHGAPDRAGLEAILRNRDGLDGLSAERVGQEMAKLVVAAGAPGCIRIMSDWGILGRVLGRAADLGGFARLHAVARDTVVAPGGKADAPLFLAALAAWTEADASALATRLRLSNAERFRMLTAVTGAFRVGGEFDERAARVLLYDLGPQGFRDALALAAARARIAADERFVHLLSLPFRWTPPATPVAGRDLAALGIEKGPRIGELVRAAEKLWIDSDFELDRAAILSRLGLTPP